MLTVSVDDGVVESQLAAGLLWCPCGGVLAPWGHARPRVVMGLGHADRWRPRRARCRSCERTHVLLPAALLVRRAYTAALIGRVLGLSATGTPQRRVAREVGLARSTVRGWISRLAVVAEVLRGHFTAWLVWLAPSHSRLAPTGRGSSADAVTAVLAAGGRAREALGFVDVWDFAAAATSGRLLSNTSAPFPAPWSG